MLVPLLMNLDMLGSDDTGALIWWDGKKYPSYKALIPHDRIYFDETRARITRRVSEVKEEIQQGINDYSLTNATSAINDIKEEIVNLKSGRDNLSENEYEFYFLQYQIEIEFMTELIEEIDVAFVTFMLLGEQNG